MIGFGGGIFMIPLLVILFNIPMHYAVGAVVISLLPAAIVSSGMNIRYKLIDYKVALWLEIPTLIGAVIGAWLTSKLSVKNLEFIFAIFLCALSVRLFYKNKSKEITPAPWLTKLNSFGPVLSRQNQNYTYEVGLGAATIFGGISGILAGLFGVGGGFMKTPIMIHIFHMPAKIAIGTAIFMIAFTSFTASVTHFKLGHIQWAIALPLATGFVGGAILGSLLKKKFTEKNMKSLISIGLFLAGLSTLIHAFGLS